MVGQSRIEGLTFIWHQEKDLSNDVYSPSEEVSLVVTGGRHRVQVPFFIFAVRT